MPQGVSWVVLAENDLYPYMVAAQLNALREAGNSLDKDGKDVKVFDSIMPDIAAEVRAAIASNTGNVLSATANSVPPECKRIVLWLILESMIGRMGLADEAAFKLSKHQEDQVEDAKERLQEIKDWPTEYAKGRKGAPYLVAMPTNPESQTTRQIPTSAATVQSNPRLFTRNTLHSL